MKRQRHLVGSDLRCRVGGLSDQRMAFLDRHELCAAIDFAGRRLDEAAHAGMAGGLQDVDRAAHVGFDIGVGCDIGKRNRDQRRQMHDVGASGRRRDHEVRIPDVAGDHFHRFHDIGGNGVEPAPGVEGVVEDDRLDVRARANQFLDDMRADESIATRHKYAGVLQIFHAGPQIRRLFQSSQCDGAIAQ